MGHATKRINNFFNGSGTEYPIYLAPRTDEYSEYTAANGTRMRVNDPYRYMEGTQNNQNLEKWIAAQNKLTDDFLSSCEQRNKFKKTIEDNSNFAKIGIPNKHGDHYYFGYNSGMMAQTAWYKIKQKHTYKIDGKNPLNNTELFMDPN